ncbi:hypothetical protein [Opitutus terrae]|uniref:Outer membrane protein beta-barrel domain-containing protein n=1 Tax=Opitutus terrae (strain DSM 11246 / JCM 15787 / PB90-1) TaxID=452637 RepID=B1ZSY4_OPITP|nr:hypothetical protein [Opitutus terrae]ACB75773.1 hypothetical protein Oter_2491 [Opitutus terrae PB90-1]
MRRFICFFVLAAACRLTAMPGPYVEAGVSYVRLSKADLPASSSFALTEVRHDRSAWSPFLAAGWDFSDRVGIRTSYRSVAGVDASTSYNIVDTTGSYYLRNRYSDDLHVITVAPEFTFRATPSLMLGVSPELNWVYARQTTRTDSNAPMILVLPYHTDSDSGLSLGGSAAMNWAWSPPWSVSLRYSWIDLDPSWNRRAHALSGAVAWRW